MTKNLAAVSIESMAAAAYIDLDLKIVEANSAFYQGCAGSREIKICEDRIYIENSEKAEEINGYVRYMVDTRFQVEAMLKNGRDVPAIEIKLFDADGDPSFCLALKPCQGRVAHSGLFIQGPLIRIELRIYRRLTICWDRVKERYLLTSAELSVLKLVNRCLPRHAIAKQRNTSAETVKSQMKGLKRKLNAKSQVEMIRNIRSHSYFFEDA